MCGYEGLVEFGENGIDPGGEVGGVVMNSVVDDEVVGDVDGGIKHGGFEVFEAVGNLPEVGGADPIACAGQVAVEVMVRWWLYGVGG